MNKERGISQLTVLCEKIKRRGGKKRLIRNYFRPFVMRIQIQHSTELTESLPFFNNNFIPYYVENKKMILHLWETSRGDFSNWWHVQKVDNIFQMCQFCIFAANIAPLLWRWCLIIHQCDKPWPPKRELLTVFVWTAVHRNIALNLLLPIKNKIHFDRILLRVYTLV